MDGGSAGVAGAFPCLMGDACKVVRATIICSTDASYLNVIQLSFSLTSLPSVTQPVDATRDYGVPVRRQPTGAQP